MNVPLFRAAAKSLIGSYLAPPTGSRSKRRSRDDSEYTFGGANTSKETSIAGSVELISLDFASLWTERGSGLLSRLTNASSRRLR